MSRSILPIVILAVLTFAHFGSAQNLYGRIEGNVVDRNGNVIPEATVTVRSLGTGALRTTTTDSDGGYRFPLLTPGMFVISADAKGFTHVDITLNKNLSAGETITIPIILGGPDASVTVDYDAAVADTSRIAVGRQLNDRDTRNLPLVSRNLYNFILLQPGVNGRKVSDPRVVDMSAAGLRRRVGYQIDGSNDNDFNLSGYRLNILSETSVQEVQLLTTSYPAEYGGTAGAIVNFITRSGTNDLNGSVSLLYRPSGLTAKPFGFQPGTGTNVSAYGITATLGGPIVKDGWHFFAAYEWTKRHYIAPITVSDTDRASLIANGVSPSIFVNKESTSDTLPYLSIRTDASMTNLTRLSVRFNNFVSDKRHAGPGGLSTTDRSFGFTGYAFALSAQAVTTFSKTLFSEFRFQEGRNILRIVGDELTGKGPTVTIANSASFGPDPAVGSISPNENTIQFQENFTGVVGGHIFKLGGGVNFIADRPTAQLASQYSFTRLQNYILAVTQNIKSYQQYQESVGDNKIPDNAIYYNAFFQDDWALSARAKLSFGLRYEYFDPPSGDPSAPLAISRAFNSDDNNFAPRIGFTYLVHDGRYRTVLRLGGGVHYDPPQMAMYRRALLSNGTSRYVSFSIGGGQPQGPVFPDRLGSYPLPPNIDTVAADFTSMYAIRSSVQVEQALSNDTSVTIGYVNSSARHIPVYRNMNCLPTGRTLADGRPVYGAGTDQCAIRVYSQFKVVKIAESGGNQNYNGMFVQLMKRFSHGVQLNATYTLSNSVDDAPEENVPGSLTLSDPSSRRTDRGSSRGDLTSVFNMSLVARPMINLSSGFLSALLNNNQFSVLMIADSGETFNITAGDLNLDGVIGPDRPVGIARNSGRLPASVGVDARYSRFITLGEKRSLEFYVEATNLINRKQVDTYTNTNLSPNVVDPFTGVLLAPIPPMSPSWRESRQVQLGAKIHF